MRRLWPAQAIVDFSGGLLARLGTLLCLFCGHGLGSLSLPGVAPVARAAAPAQRAVLLLLMVRRRDRRSRLRSRHLRAVFANFEVALLLAVGVGGRVGLGEDVARAAAAGQGRRRRRLSGEGEFALAGGCWTLLQRYNVSIVGLFKDHAARLGLEAHAARIPLLVRGREDVHWPGQRGSCRPRHGLP